MDFEKQLKFCQNTSLWLPVLFENAGIPGEEICKVSGGSSCYNVQSLTEGLCKAAGICRVNGAVDLINQV